MYDPARDIFTAADEAEGEGGGDAVEASSQPSDLHPVIQAGVNPPSGASDAGARASETGVPVKASCPKLKRSLADAELMY